MFTTVLTQYNGMILGPIAKVLGWILNLIFEFLSNFGIENMALCIILFTFIVKALMIPLTIKQQKFTKLSSKMNPELTKIQAKYKGKRDEASLRKQQLETQAVYQKYGASPTSGCLPMLITFPILFALYRVIYNIPAYVDGIKVYYENVANAISAQPNFVAPITELAEKFAVSTKGWADLGTNIPTDSIIDVLAKFRTADWTALQDTFANIAPIIGENADKINHINSLIGGLNIADAPGFAFPGILVPILAVVTQMIQTKQLTASNPTDPNAPGAGMMNSMNTVMPIMSGIMCLVLSVGIGIYWVAGSVFQIIQQYFVNKYMNRLDVDALIEDNVKKANKKKERKGIDPNKVEEMAKVQTRSIKDHANSTKPYVNNGKTSDYKQSDVSYKSGSIAANAHLLNNRNIDGKGDNK